MHFLSDVIWSGLIAYGVANVLYYSVLAVPTPEDRIPAVDPRMFERGSARTPIIAWIY